MATVPLQAGFRSFSIDAVGRQFRLPRMIKSGSAPRLPVFGSSIRFLARFQCFFVLFAAVLSAAAQSSQDQQIPDVQYIHIMTIIDRADALRLAGHMDAAKVKYNEARTNLLNFRAHNPLFDPKTVAYRLNEVTTWVEARPPVPASSSADESKPMPAPVAKSPVKLLNPGAEPRAVLRLHPTAGDKQTVIMTLKTKVTMPPPPPGGAAAPAMPSIPPITIPMDITVQSVTPSGDINYTTVMGEPGIVEDTNTPPQMAQAMKAAMAKIKGITASGTISSRGISKKVDIKVPPDADPQMRQSLENMREGMANLGSPLPEEAVGVGAKWEVKMPVKTEGMTIEQTSDYQLDSAAGDHVTTKFTLTQSTANSRVQISSNGSGTITSDLSKLVALQANMDMHMELGVGGAAANNQAQPNSMKMDVNISMEAQ